MASLLVLPALAFVVAWWITRRARSPDSWLHVLDRPNSRSLHSSPIPRSGGLGVAAGSSFAFLAVARDDIDPIWLGPGVGAALLVITGLLDDRRGLGVSTRMAVHVLCALLAVWAGLRLSPLSLPGATLPLSAYLAVPLTMLFVIWFINLYNFMDGMDGFAGGMALFGFGGLALLGLWTQHPGYAAFNAAIAAAAAGFLIHNFPPARIFLGDAGAPFLGYLAAVSILWGLRLGIFALWVPLLIFSPFLVDATVTLIRRLWRGERIWEAHCSHYYQRLVRLGWSHRRTVLAAYALMLALLVSAIWGAQSNVVLQWTLLIAWAMAYFAIALTIHHKEQTRAN